MTKPETKIKRKGASKLMPDGRRLLYCSYCGRGLFKNGYAVGKYICRHCVKKHGVK